MVDDSSDVSKAPILTRHTLGRSSEALGGVKRDACAHAESDAAGRNSGSAVVNVGIENKTWQVESLGQEALVELLREKQARRRRPALQLVRSFTLSLARLICPLARSSSSSEGLVLSPCSVPTRSHARLRARLGSRCPC
eukprot:4285673-Pleurochrysis_carterae.AAC.1